MPGLFYLIIVFIFGTIVGSFLNCVIYRLEQGQSFLKGRSYCPLCKHTLSWQDLVPVLSFLFLKGKCGYCHQKISTQYPLVELLTGAVFLLIFWNLEFGIWNLLFYFIISSFLIIIFVYDLKHHIIPDKVVYPAILIVFLYRIFEIFNFGHWNLFRIWNLGFGILPSLFLLIIILLSRGRWMGFGDFILAILMGLFLGWPNILVALFLAFFIGAVIGIGLIVAGRKKLSSEVPFGPFLVTGTFLAMLWGGEIVNWYLTFFLLQ